MVPACFSPLIELWEKRQSAREWRVCTFKAGSPDELRGKQYRISPLPLTATRNRIASGASSLDAVKLRFGKIGAPKASSSFENEADVSLGLMADAVCG